MVFKGNRLEALKLKALEIFGFEGISSDQIQIAKHQPHNFKWMYIDPNETITVKNKKGKG